MSTTGAEKIAEFAAAPKAIQSAFFAAIRTRVNWEHQLEQAREAVGDPDLPIPIELRHREPRPVAWDSYWQRRADRYREAEERGRPVDYERERLRLDSIPADEYVEALTGEVVPYGRKINCPLPDHDERTPSFHVYRDDRWRCFGCGHRGSIYELAGLLWGLQRSGSDFRRIHERLIEIFP